MCKNCLSLIISLILLTGCSSRSGKSDTTQSDSTTVENIVQVEVVKELSPLVSEEIILEDNVFGKDIELKGKQIVLDAEPFKMSEPEMWIKDDYFLLQNLFGNEFMYMLFKLPDFEHIASFGVRGNGPDEFLFPHIVGTSRKDKLAYIYEKKAKAIYEVGYDGKYTRFPIEFEEVKKAVHSDKQLFVAEGDVYYYAEYVPQGKAIFKALQVGDSLHTEQIYKLSFSPKHKSWSAYLGDFIVHSQGKRLAYAYKSFKRIVFLDPETGDAKVVSFNKDGVVAANDIVTLGPDNVTYYWGASASENHLYLTYSGRTPIQVTQENTKTDGYIFVEQFDWNGTPIRKFRLDHWGPTYVDEKTKKIYQLNYKYDDPLFVYELPD